MKEEVFDENGKIAEIVVENPKIDQMRSLYDRCFETFKKKNADYGDSFDKSLNKRGYQAALVRMEDKFERLDHLLTSGSKAQVDDETVSDTALDLANYCVMLARYIEERSKK